MLKRLITTTAVAAGVALAVAPAAHAVTVSYSADTLTITGGDEVNAVTVTLTSEGKVLVSDSLGGGATLSGGGGGACTQYVAMIGPEYNGVECDRAAVSAAQASLGGGDDAYRDEVDGIADTVSGGAGDDALRGAIGGADPAADTIRGDDGIDELWAGTGDGTTCDGGAGNDTLWCTDVLAGRTTTLLGGPGDDTIYGGPSDDALDGGDGTDTLAGNLGADDLRGGAGLDTVAEPRASGTTIHWSIDDVANDGLNGTEGDNVRTDVERIIGSSSNDILVGSPGADMLDGRLGDDQITGMGGGDELSGDFGNDVIRATDGATDTVYCGADLDTVEADANDTVAGDCETVRRGSAPPEPTPDPGGGGGDEGDGPAAAIAAPRGSFKRSVAAFSVTAPGAGTLAATVKAGGKRLGKATRSVSAAGKTTLKIKLKGKAARKLKRRKSFKVKLTTVFTPQGGQAGAPTTRTVKLKRKR